MTFTEAALQVLRLVGKPLHYKEITDVAIEKDLLSHVGKSPEVTMGARLAAMIKKDPSEGGLVRVKPGVFALAEWDEATVQSGLADKTPALKKLSQLEAKQEQQQQEPSADEDTDEDGDDAVAEAPPPPEPSTVSLAVPSTEDTDPEELGADELARAELTAAATEIFEAEDDDDEPILGGSEERDDDDDDEAGRRRRRRRRRGREREDDDLPSYTVSDVSELAVPRDELERDAERGDKDRGERGDRERGDRERGDRERGDRGDKDRGERGERDKDRGERGERDKDRDRTDERKDRPGRLDELAGADLADALEEQLGGFRRSGTASLKQLTEQPSRGRNRGRGGGGGGDSPLAQIYGAAMRADNARREAEGRRPRFRLLTGGRVALTDWALDKELVRMEREIQEQVTKHQELMLKLLARRISELPQRASAELCITLLSHAGYGQLKTARRPGASAAELHLSGIYAGPLGDEAAAVVIRRDNKDIGRERVAELRGALHHYGPATVGVLVTTGQALSGAREESQVVGATPVHLIDAAKLARLCLKSGVGVVRQNLGLAAPDAELFEALRGQ